MSVVCVPPDEAQWSGPVSIHEDAKWQRGSTEQKRSNGKAQVEHLLLLYTAESILMNFGSSVSNLCLIF